jgi:quinol monooxygenase YgiN
VPYTPGMGIFRALAVITIVLIGSAVVRSVAAQEPARGGKSVYVVTHVDVTPNYTADTTKALHEFAAESKRDPGVVRFEVLQQDSRANHYTIVEVWQTRQAFEAHSAAEHTKRFREKLQPMLGSPFDERLHDILP